MEREPPAGGVKRAPQPSRESEEDKIDRQVESIQWVLRYIGQKERPNVNPDAMDLDESAPPQSLLQEWASQQ